MAGAPPTVADVVPSDLARSRVRAHEEGPHRPKAMGGFCVTGWLDEQGHVGVQDRHTVPAIAVRPRVKAGARRRVQVEQLKDPGDGPAVGRLARWYMRRSIWRDVQS